MLVKDIALIALSSSLLILSFPKFDLGFLAWFGLVPLLISLIGKSLWYSFFLSLTCGVLFFVGIFNWILALPKFTLLQQIPLALYLGSYIGLFGLAFRFISTGWSHTAALWAAPFIWVSLEYLRSNLYFLALPWGLLAHSQHRYPTIIQIASCGGTYSISFLIVLVNASLAGIMYPKLSRSSGKYLPPTPPLERGGLTIPLCPKGKAALIVTTTLLLLLTFLYGQVAISKPLTGDRLKISLVQGNIEQVNKWDPKFADKIMQVYSELTDRVSRDEPSIITWPETATPRSIAQSPMVYKGVKKSAEDSGAYLLLGSADQQKFSGKSSTRIEKYFNSAYLISPDPSIVKNQRYDKIRLFPFREYLPYKDIIPWSLLQLRESAEYTPGNDFTVFTIPGARFGVVICWENLFPDLFRQFVKRGAQFMVNITNEAHFGDSAAPYHLAAISIFRAVENRRYLVRCANTGVSCFIDPYGKIVDRIRDERGKETFFRGVMTRSIVSCEEETIYTRYGDVCAWVAVFGSVFFLFLAAIRGLIGL